MFHLLKCIDWHILRYFPIYSILCELFYSIFIIFSIISLLSFLFILLTLRDMNYLFHKHVLGMSFKKFNIFTKLLHCPVLIDKQIIDIALSPSTIVDRCKQSLHFLVEAVKQRSKILCWHRFHW